MRLDSVSYNPYSNRWSGEQAGDVDQWMKQNIRVCSGDEYDRYRGYLVRSERDSGALDSGHAAYDTRGRGRKRKK